VGEPADEKLLMTNPTHEPDEQRPQKPIRIVLPREVCTTPEEKAKLLHRAVMEAVAELRLKEATGSAETRDDRAVLLQDRTPNGRV
jgi:hypothetical protein